MPINFSSKLTFIKKIIVKEDQDNYFFIGEYNIIKSKSYLKIKKLKFNSINYQLFSKYKLKDILEEDIEPNDVLKDFPFKSIKEINCLFGFIKFNMGYYALFSCDSDIIGKIGRNIIYRVDRLIYFPLFDVDEDFKKNTEFLNEVKYMTLVNSVSYDKQLYFSYSYDLSKTLQRNFVESFKREIVPNYEKNAYMPNKNINKNKSKLSLKKYTNYYFCWNYFHIKEFFNLIKNKAWINFFIYGYFGQTFCGYKGLRLLITVIGRRNRHYAGMRFLKRGICDDGNVANDVETEQILEEKNTTWLDKPKISSFIQLRGSIPIYWYQKQSLLSPKPLINVNLSDIKFEATRRHFSSLLERYGQPCIVFNLTKKNEDGGKPQETLLNEWYYNSINYINNNMDKNLEKIIYYHYDLKNERYKKDFYRQFYNISCPFIAKTNLFSFIPNLNNKFHLSLQNGVVRTNCIDCLDRTNVFQQIIGIAVMVIQLGYFGINENFPENENENIYGVLTELYIKMGHELSNQYTGSSALKQTITDHRSLIDKTIDSFYEIFIAVKRIFINYFSDQWKQNAMNLFLGKYPINSGLPYIWDMPNDEILHKKKKLKNICECENYFKYIIFNLFSDIDNKPKIYNNGKMININRNLGKNISKTNDIISDIKRKNIKMSTTSLLIYKELCSKMEKNTIHRDNSDSSLEIRKIKNTNIINQYIQSFQNKDSNLNEYILDYNSYLDFKSKHRSKFEEERKFENDSTMTFLLEAKNLDIREFNNFEYYNANFIKKNGINSNIENNNIQTEVENKSQYQNNKHYIDELINIKTNFFSTRKNSNYKFKTPIKKNTIRGSKYSQQINEVRRFSKFKDKYGTFFVHYTPFVSIKPSNFSKFAPSNLEHNCKNPRNVVELKKEMLKLDSASFQFNDDDFNKINNFTQSIEKQLKKKDIYELEPFNTCDLENTEGIYEIHKHIEKEIQVFDPFQSLVCEEPKKEEIDNEIDDYIIFDVKKNVLYKKSNDTKIKKTNLMPIKDFFPEIGHGKKEENKLKEDKEEEKLKIENERTSKSVIKVNLEEENQFNSPKITIERVKKFPLKIDYDYFSLKNKI